MEQANRLEKILQQFGEIAEKNQSQYDKEMEAIKRAEEELEEKLDNGLINDHYEVNHRSDELLSLIEKYEFIIHGYKYETDVDEDDYEALLETYFCEKNNWTFAIYNYEDLDIDEGIFALRDLKNIETGEVIDFCCDLGCRNTPPEKLEAFLKFLSFNSLEAFTNANYPYILSLPYLLESQGLKVELVDFSLGVDDSKGYIHINDEIAINFMPYVDHLKGYITKRTSGKLLTNGLRYQFEYRGDSDFGMLFDMINAFAKHLRGECGFFENDKYYTQSDFSLFLKSFKDRKEPYKKAWNNYHIKIAEQSRFDKVNKYTGQEILSSAVVSFNDAAQWSIGTSACICVLELSYNRKIDADNCYLSMSFYEKEFGKNVLLDALTFKGSFTEMCEIVSQYILKMAEIFNLEL